MSTKAPAFQFYVGDHRRNTGLQSCSLAARGLWTEMLCIFHESEPYGHLTVAGVPVSPEELARLVGAPLAETRRLLAELERRKVFERNEEGVIFSPEMVKQEHIRLVRAKAGKRGGNPRLLDKQTSKQNEDLFNQGSKQIPTPSVAVAVSSSSTEPTPPNPPPQAGGAGVGGGEGDQDSGNSNGNGGGVHDVPEAWWALSEDRMVPHEQRPDLLEAARQRVALGESKTLEGAVKWVARKAAREQNGTGREDIPASVKGGPPSELERIRSQSIARARGPVVPATVP